MTRVHIKITRGVLRWSNDMEVSEGYSLKMIRSFLRLRLHTGALDYHSAQSHVRSHAHDTEDDDQDRREEVQQDVP